VIVEVPEDHDPIVRAMRTRMRTDASDLGAARWRETLRSEFEILDELTFAGIPRTLFLLRSRA
jgi:hypothetical protein